MNYNLIYAICRRMIFGKYFIVGLGTGVVMNYFVNEFDHAWQAILVFLAFFIATYIFIYIMNTHIQLTIKSSQFCYSSIAASWITPPCRKGDVGTIIFTIIFAISLYALYISRLYKRAIQLQEFQYLLMV